MNPVWQVSSAEGFSVFYNACHKRFASATTNVATDTPIRTNVEVRSDSACRS